MIFEFDADAAVDALFVDPCFLALPFVLDFPLALDAVLAFSSRFVRNNRRTYSWSVAM